MDYFETAETVSISIEYSYNIDYPLFYDLKKLEIPTYWMDAKLKIYSNGCNLEEGGYNCTVVCLDPEQAFRNIETVQNCINYPYISYALEHTNLTFEDPKSDIEEYGFLNHSSTDVEKIEDIMFNCFNEVSKGQDGCARWFDAPLDDNLFSECLNSICSSVEASVDNNLGGIGSFVSYYYQIIALLCAWIALRFFQSWTQVLSFCLYYFSFGRHNAWMKAKSYQALARKSGQHAALLTSTVELQKAQCFFMIAIQVAAILAIKELSYFQLENYAQLVHTLVLLHTVAAAGIVPVVFGLFTLHVSNMKSSFVYGLTALTVSISSVTRHYKDIIEIYPDKVVGPKKKPINCGGQSGPAMYCSGGFDLSMWIPGIEPLDAFYHYQADEPIDSRSIDHLFRFSLVVLVILFFNQFPLVRSVRYGQERQAKWMTVFEWLKLRFLNMSQTRMLDNLRLSSYVSRKKLIFCFETVSILAADILFLCFLCNHLIRLRTLSKIFHSTEVEWDYGQIVAVMVLVPPVVEYVYLASRGMVKGSQYRLPNQYRVTKEEKAKQKTSHEDWSPYSRLNDSVQSFEAKNRFANSYTGAKPLLNIEDVTKDFGVC